MPSKRLAWLAAFLAAASIGLNACGEEPSAPTESAPSAAAAPPESAPSTATAPPDTAAAPAQPTPEPECIPILYGNLTYLFTIPSIGFSYQMASADFNGDGFMDIVVARLTWPTSNVEELEILLNDGAGGLVRATSEIFVDTIPATQHPRHIVLADFNGDGITDIFIADHGQDVEPWPGYHNTLVLSTPDGRLVDAAANIPQQPDYSHSAAAADIDGDGDIDLYIGNTWGEARIPPEIWLNDGTGIFTVDRERLPPDQANLELNKYTASAFADVNNDDAPDLILGADETTSDSVVLLNDGSGYFSLLPGALPAKPLDPGNIGTYIVSDDINRDGYQDLIISYALGWGPSAWEGRVLQILVNNGDGTFRDETDTRLPQSNYDSPWIMAITLHDFDRDGDLDIITRHEDPDVIDQPYYLNDGSGFYQEPDTFQHLTGRNTHVYVFFDLDGDGGLDTVSVTYNEVFFLMRDLGCRTTPN